MKSEQPQMQTYGEEHVPAFGYELLRMVLLPELLGEELEPILYWAGRKLARKYPCNTIEELISFFEQAAWGSLEFCEESKGKMKFELRSNLINARFKDKSNDKFSLESGFLAEQIQHIKGFTADSLTEIKNNRDKRVLFEVAWDTKDPIKNT
ncbi:putative hydrocarbon binding protein [Pullulanibacillus pueri]|uniref:DUF2507 domain-containing protein n=1 Tax=Pullulanibacillus pueri TaxID=1437324 RepID=A0A8J3EM51_9BACL|nr:DUF2507 domain-containing protein [Pullulanibacillus pueri]MBM7681998.1 putative hydrocarbon binding protein [Pullulanibacillus pueri]GGH83706.1 hypothetical protein GCM10007096_25090 [Pullulanibacillus pueri]